MRKPLLGLCLVMSSSVVAYAIGTIKEVRLVVGYDSVNRISSPVFDTGAAPSLHFAIRADYDRSAKVVRRGATNMFTRGPEYNLDKTVDLAALFGEALRAEAGAMGFRVSSTSDAAWSVDGSLKDVYLESKQIPYGATLFYGYMDVAMQLRGGGGNVTTRLRFHNYFGGYNAGLGRKDEAQEALARLLIESAQEAISRLNRQFLKVLVHPDLAAQAFKFSSGNIATDDSLLHRVGLSGSAGATQTLLGFLSKEGNENRRSALIDALARLGSPDAVGFLASRYAAEDEDCRWYTLKAMDYIGGAEALAVVRSQGSKDKDGGPRRLAQRILSAQQSQ